MYKRIIATIISCVFLVNNIGPVYAQSVETGHASSLPLPEPGTMVNLSGKYVPLLIKGLVIHPENPFAFDFLVDTGNDQSVIPAKAGIQDSGSPIKAFGDDKLLKQESQKLIKYFLAALTIPEKDLWVNLSPYEKDHMLAKNLAQTQMGQDMLAQDYILKQLTASLIYPEKDLGKEFWNRVYAKAQQLYGTTQVPVDTFNKVWIVADKADVYEHGNVAYVVGAHLKVMMEEDYLAISKHADGGVAEGGASPVARSEARTKGDTRGQDPDIRRLGSQIVRDIVLPEIEREVNQGKNFAPLRQMFNSMILASWYKMALKDAIITKLYGNQSKVKVGIRTNDPTQINQIYDRYLKAYKKGVFNYIKEEALSASAQPVPRKYFSGGLNVWERMPDGGPNRIKNSSLVTAAMIAHEGDIYRVSAAMAAPRDGDGVDALREWQHKYSTDGETVDRNAYHTNPALGESKDDKVYTGEEGSPRTDASAAMRSKLVPEFIAKLISQAQKKVITLNNDQPMKDFVAQFISDPQPIAESILRAWNLAVPGESKTIKKNYVLPQDSLRGVVEREDVQFFKKKVRDFDIAFGTMVIFDDGAWIKVSMKDQNNLVIEADPRLKIEWRTNFLEAFLQDRKLSEFKERVKQIIPATIVPGEDVKPSQEFSIKKTDESEALSFLYSSDPARIATNIVASLPESMRGNLDKAPIQALERGKPATQAIRLHSEKYRVIPYGYTASYGVRIYFADQSWVGVSFGNGFVLSFRWSKRPGIAIEEEFISKFLQSFHVDETGVARSGKSRKSARTLEPAMSHAMAALAFNSYDQMLAQQDLLVGYDFIFQTVHGPIIMTVKEITDYAIGGVDVETGTQWVTVLREDFRNDASPYYNGEATPQPQVIGKVTGVVAASPSFQDFAAESRSKMHAFSSNAMVTKATVSKKGQQLIIKGKEAVELNFENAQLKKRFQLKLTQEGAEIAVKIEGDVYNNGERSGSDGFIQEAREEISAPLSDFGLGIVISIDKERIVTIKSTGNKEWKIRASRAFEIKNAAMTGVLQDRDAAMNSEIIRMARESLKTHPKVLVIDTDILPQLANVVHSIYGHDAISFKSVEEAVDFLNTPGGAADQVGLLLTSGTIFHPERFAGITRPIPIIMAPAWDGDQGPVNLPENVVFAADFKKITQQILGNKAMTAINFIRDDNAGGIHVGYTQLNIGENWFFDLEKNEDKYIFGVVGYEQTKGGEYLIKISVNSKASKEIFKRLLEELPGNKKLKTAIADTIATKNQTELEKVFKEQASEILKKELKDRIETIRSSINSAINLLNKDAVILDTSHPSMFKLYTAVTAMVTLENSGFTSYEELSGLVYSIWSTENPVASLRAKDTIFSDRINAILDSMDKEIDAAMTTAIVAIKTIKLMEGQSIIKVDAVERLADQLNGKTISLSVDETDKMERALGGQRLTERFGHYGRDSKAIGLELKVKNPTGNHRVETLYYSMEPDGFIDLISELMANNLTVAENIYQKAGNAAMTINIATIDQRRNPNDQVGGIDLNAANLGMKISKDADGGVKVTFDPVMIEKFKRQGFDGFEPVILNITPIQNIRLILGLESSNLLQLAKI